MNPFSIINITLIVSTIKIIPQPTYINEILEKKKLMVRELPNIFHRNIRENRFIYTLIIFINKNVNILVNV